MSPQEIGLTLSLFPSPPNALPPPPPPALLQRSKSNKFMAPGTTPASSQPRPELALYYFNSPTMLPQQKKPIPLMPSNSDNVVDVVMAADGKGPETRKRERSPLPSLEDSEKGNKRKSPRKMRSSPFLAAATGHFFQAARSFSSSASASSSPSAAVAARPGTSPKADGTTGVRDGDTVTSPTTATHPNASKSDNSAEMETVKVISRAVRQRVAQSSSPSTAASAITVDTAAPARSVEVECTSPASSSASVPPAPSSSSSKSPFKKRRRVVKNERKPSPLRNTPLTPADFLAPSTSSSRAAASPAPSTSPSKEKKIVKRKPVVWEKRPLLQKVILKEFERTPHGAEIIRRGAKLGIAFLEEQRHLVRNAGKSGRKSTSSDEDETAEGGVVVKSKSKDVSSMKHWGRIVKTALAGPLKEMAGPMAGDGRPPMPMIRAW